MWAFKWHHQIWPWVTLKVRLKVTQTLMPYNSKTVPDKAMNRKSYVGFQMTPSDLTLKVRLNIDSRSLKLWCLITPKRCQIEPLLQLNMNRKSYVSFQMTPSDLTLSDLEGPTQLRSDSTAGDIHIVVRGRRRFSSWDIVLKLYGGL